MKHIISFSHFCFFQNAVLHKMLNLGFRNFSLVFWSFKPIFFRMYLLLDSTSFLNLWLSVWVDICIWNRFHEVLALIIELSLSFIIIIWCLKIGGKMVRALVLHYIYLKSWKPNLFQTFRMLLSDWFGPKCKYKVSTYLVKNVINWA